MCWCSNAAFFSPNSCKCFLQTFDGRHSWVSINLFIPWCVGFHCFGPCGIVLRVTDDSLWNSCDLTEFLLAMHFTCKFDLKNHHYVLAFFCFRVGGCAPWGWSNTLVWGGGDRTDGLMWRAWRWGKKDDNIYKHLHNKLAYLLLKLGQAHYVMFWNS